jgi:hypothetical protein
LIQNRIKAAIAAVTIAGATAAAMLVPTTPAVAFSSGGLVLDIVVQSPAHLVAKGAAISVPIIYTCSGGSFAQVSVSVTERVSGKAIASGGGQLTNPVCTGEIESGTLDVTAFGARAFAKGVAFSNGNIFGCSGFCAQETDSRTITIK